MIKHLLITGLLHFLKVLLASLQEEQLYLEHKLVDQRQKAQDALDKFESNISAKRLHAKLAEQSLQKDLKILLGETDSGI